MAGLQLLSIITLKHAKNLFLNSCSCIVVVPAGTLFWKQSHRLYLVELTGTRVSDIFVHASEIFVPTQAGIFCRQVRFGGAGAANRLHGIGLVGAGVEGAAVVKATVGTIEVSPIVVDATVVVAKVVGGAVVGGLVVGIAMVVVVVVVIFVFGFSITYSD